MLVDGTFHHISIDVDRRSDVSRFYDRLRSRGFPHKKALMACANKMAHKMFATVSQRLFEDRCRQLIGFKGDVDARQALVDETLRLAICVSDNIDDTEGMIPDVLDHLQDNGGDPDPMKAISYIANNLKEDRARATRIRASSRTGA